MSSVQSVTISFSIVYNCDFISLFAAGFFVKQAVELSLKSL